jgi:hypothetical protein
LDVFALTAIAHTGFEQAPQMIELLGQDPALQWPRLIQGAWLLLNERQNERDEEKWKPVFRSSSRSTYKHRSLS